MGYLPRPSQRPHFYNGTLKRVSASGTVTLYPPTANTDQARGTAFSTALGDLQQYDQLWLAPNFTYEVPTNLTSTVADVSIYGQGSTLKRLDSTESDWILNFSPTAGHSVLNGINFDGNRTTVTLTTERGEGLRVGGNGVVDVINCYAHDGPLGNDAAMNFFIIGDGHKRFINCKADNPSYANYRIRALTSEFINCDSFVTTYTGGKARFWVMDGSAVRSCQIRGGIWWTDQEYEINANFDPDLTSAMWCEELILDGIQMDFGTGHDNDSGDSYIKFDNVRKVICRNITHRHSVPGTLAEYDAGPPVYNPREGLFTVGSNCKSAYFEGILADGYLDLAGSAGGPYTDIVVVRDSEWGINSEIKHAVENCNHAKLLILENSRFYNIKGSGSGGLRCVLENSQSTNGQQIRIKNCHFETEWDDNAGLFYRKVETIGSCASEGVTIVDNGTYDTYFAPTNYERLMASATPGDPHKVYLTRNMLGSGRYSLGTGTYANTHPTPVDPGVEDEDWFGSNVTGPDGSVIINENCGAGGNGFGLFWIKNESGNFVEDPAVRTV